jgi:UDP-3-O-[3-hydroxymyristoyl] N-acetylglucosamine deacetylase
VAVSSLPSSSSVDNTAASITVEGIGLITGKPVTVTLQRAEEGQGVVFYPDDWLSTPIPARLASVVNTDRGVTLANRNGQLLSIVEHFLAATAMAGVTDLDVLVQGAPELPILEGSAIEWLKPLRELAPEATIPKATRVLKHAVFYRVDEGDIAVYAIPAERFSITYAVNFEHDALKTRWARWNSEHDSIETLAQAGTFGHLSELPALQARGLALGVQADNTLGLLENGEYTRPLRQTDEPIYHKMLDLVGDLSLSGLNPLTLKAHIFALNAGHGSHTAFAKLLTVLT